MATTPVIGVIDEVLADPAAYRAWALRQPFATLREGARALHGIAPCPDAALPHFIAERYPLAVPTHTVLRHSPLGQLEPTFIHTDVCQGTWAAICYLSPAPPSGDGTAFYLDRLTGSYTGVTAEDPTRPAEILSYQDPDRWVCWYTVEARFNRLAIFPAPCFHSRTLPENYGVGDDARLVQLIFGKGTLTWPSL
jgi:hypothetical protein